MQLEKWHSKKFLRHVYQLHYFFKVRKIFWSDYEFEKFFYLTCILRQIFIIQRNDRRKQNFFLSSYIFFEKSFLYFFRQWKHCRPFVESFLARFSILHCMCSKKQMEEIIFLWKNSILLIIFAHWAKKCSALCDKISCRVVKPAFYVSIRTFWTKQIDRVIYFSHFPDLEQKFFWHSVKCFSAGLPNLISRVEGNVFRHDYFPRKQSFFISQTLSQKLLGTLARIFRQRCQNCILGVHRKSFMKKSSCLNKNYNFLIVFGHWEKKLSVSWQKKLAGLSNMHSTCS